MFGFTMGKEKRRARQTMHTGLSYSTGVRTSGPGNCEIEYGERVRGPWGWSPKAYLVPKPTSEVLFLKMAGSITFCNLPSGKAVYNQILNDARIKCGSIVSSHTCLNSSKFWFCVLYTHLFFVKVSKAAKSKEQSGSYDRKLYQRWKLLFYFILF